MLQLPLLLEPDQLEPLLQNPELLLVDVRNPDSYGRGHIPGAARLDYSAIVAAQPPALGLLPDESQLSAVLSMLGLRPDRHVVAYDEEGGGYAGRLLWTLELLGHARGSLLNGGFIAWIAEDRPLERQPVTPGSSAYRARLDNPTALADKSYILERLGRPDLALLDTRSPLEYRGVDVRAARGGHIPGAVNFNWTDAMDIHRHLRFKPDATLREMLTSVGVTPDKEVIVYCQTHHRSAHTYMVLKHLGYPRVRGYPGAWSEWGNDPDLPVASP